MSQPELIAKINPESGSRRAKETLKALHKQMGIAMRVGEIVRKALDEHLIEQEIVDQCTFDGLSDLCREALKEKDPTTRLPYAKPIGGGKDARWQRLALFSCPEAIELLTREHKGIQSDIKEFRILLDHFRDRFGDAVPDFPIA